MSNRLPPDKPARERELDRYKPTIGRILKSLWYELFGPTQFSPYRQAWTVSTNLLAALEQSEGFYRGAASDRERAYDTIAELTGRTRHV